MLKQIWFVLTFLFVGTFCIQAQDVTKVVGKIKDARTNEALPFVDIYFEGTYVGTSSDLNGEYVLNTKFPSDSITAKLLGFESLTVAIQKDVRRQVINFDMVEEGVLGKEVVIIERRKRYRKKNNPAVELMQRVIDKKGENRLESNDFYSYDMHEKVEMDLNNITEDFTKRKFFNKVDFMWEYLDTSKVNGKVFLPIYMKEVLSTVYYKKDGDEKITYENATKMTEFDEAMDDETMKNLSDALYQNVNIYDNTIDILGKQFLSPVAPLALNFYRFYITDTVMIDNKKNVHISFIPKNKASSGFIGDIYIGIENNDAIKRIDFRILGDMNINWVRDIAINQEFEKLDSNNILVKDHILVDYSITKNGLGFFANRNVSYKNYSFEPIDDSLFSGIENTIIAKDAFERSDEYWSSNRITKLDNQEQGIYEMIDTLKTVPAYKNFLYSTKVFTTGYLPIGPFDLGSLPTYISGNGVEGWRLKFGAETNYKFSRKLRLDGFAAYGLGDERWKYGGGVHYSFNKEYKEGNKHYIEANYQRETIFPGVFLKWMNGDNLLLSLRRGTTNFMLIEDGFDFNYFKTFPSFELSFSYVWKNSKPYGELVFPREVNGELNFLDEIVTSEIGFNFEYAPNKQMVVGRQLDYPIINNFPIFNLSYSTAIKGLLGGDYNFHRVTLNIFKKIPLSVAGKLWLEVEAGKVFGNNLPYTTLNVVRANQAYSYQIDANNMMNFMEFINDEYAMVNAHWYMDGVIFNRIPLWRKLKLKEVVALRATYGRLSDENDPNLNPSIPQFLSNESGQPITYALDGKPYVEASAGVYNLFRVLRVDMVKRLNYLDHPNVPSLWGVKGLGVRVRVKVEF